MPRPGPSRRRRGPAPRDAAAAQPLATPPRPHGRRNPTPLPTQALPELATLNAGGNPVSALPSFAGCPKLRVLIVDDCDLATIDASFSPSTLPKLERLIVSGERLSDGAKTSVAAFADACKTNGGWVRGL